MIASRNRRARVRQLQAHVRQLERCVRRGELPDAAACDELERRAASCAPLSPRLGGRVASLRRHVALQSRQVPRGVLDDMVGAVHAQVAEEADDPAQHWRRAGLSNSFLDAPHQLVVWRRMAVAAMLLVSVGAGAVLTGALQWGPRASSNGAAGTPIDPRDDLLPPYAPRRFTTERSRRAMFPGTVRVVGDGSRPVPASAADTTVVFPIRDLSSTNVSDMLDGLAIPDMGSAPLVERN